MVEKNPNLHGTSYMFIPVNRVTSLFRSRDDARGAVGELQKLGFPEDTLEVFLGEAGAEALDLSGEAHGPVARSFRNLEALFALEAGESHKLANDLLHAGGVAVAVDMEGRQELKDRVAQILKAHRGQVVRYWSRWTIETLD
jgi:hypothetical protein